MSDHFTIHEALSDIRERLATMEAYQEDDREMLKDIRKELAALRWRVAGIAATVSGLVGGGMSLW